MNNFFKTAKPIWAKIKEKYTVLGLYTTISSDNLKLKIAAGGNYRIFINGEFFYCGPARCAHGFHRVDEICLPSNTDETNIAIEVINYSVGSFSDIRQEGFVQAEIYENDKIISATGANGFEYFYLTERVKRVQRYSFQRPWAESYKLTPDTYNWRIGGKSSNAKSIEVVLLPEKKLISRNINNYFFPKNYIESCNATGTFRIEKPKEYIKDRSLTDVIESPNKTPEGFPENQLEQHLTDEIQEMKNVTVKKIDSKFTGEMKLNKYNFEIVSFKTEKTGFLFADISCKKCGTLYLLFDEILINGDVNALRLACCNVIRLDMEEGDYNFQSTEAFGMKYLKVLCISGEFSISNIGITELVCPQPIIRDFNCKDDELKLIYNAAKETYMQNVVDIFMDCPTRERAGWLCDSYFEAKAEHYFTGENKVEFNFLENYLLPEKFTDIADGMVPMCYPADHWDNSFIPNWSLWLILELADYKQRTNDTQLIIDFKDRIYGILSWFKQYENSDGLLEKLPAWVFVEWSKSNDLVQDINFPTNMLYSLVLKVVAELYNDNSLKTKSVLLKKTIQNRSFTGDFFCDNEVYVNDKLVLSGERTETCQYYAFFTDVATPQTYPELWNKLISEFGPKRLKNGRYKNIYPSNAFIGNFLRLYLLCKNSLYNQMLEEIKGYFLHMAKRTGTLWEHSDEQASCNHGFASFIALLIHIGLNPNDLNLNNS